MVLRGGSSPSGGVAASEELCLPPPTYCADNNNERGCRQPTQRHMDDVIKDDEEPSGLTTDERYSYGRHTMPDETSEDAMRESAATEDGADADLLNEAADQYEEMDKTPREYECTVCGLGHGHDSEKHDIRPIFGVREEFARKMRYEPRCHCGVNELAVYVDHIDKVDTQVFEAVLNDHIDSSVVNDVRSAADSAPIDSTARMEIEAIREAFEKTDDPQVGGTYAVAKESLGGSDDDDGPTPAADDDLSDVVQRVVERNPAAVWEYSSGRAPDEALDALRRKVFNEIDWEATPESVDQAIEDAISDADPGTGDPFASDD